MNPDLLLRHFDQISEAPDAIPRLRRFILDLAVRGKLVPQDPKDERGEELLKRIEQTRKQLIAARKLRKQIPFVPVSDDNAGFDIPKRWAKTRLGNVYDVRDGTHDTPKYVASGYPLVTSKNLSSGKLSFDDIKFISEKDHQKISERSLVEKGDILLAMIGSIGNPVIVDTDRCFSIKNVALFKYYDRDLCTSGYLKLFLQYATGKMQELAAGGLQPFVSLGFLRNYPFPLPPLVEQHRIVAKVDELMALCDELEAAQARREKRRDRLVAATLPGLNNGTNGEDFHDTARFYFNHIPRLTTRSEHIQQLRQTILNLAVRGKLVPQDPNDEPALELLKRIEKEKTCLTNEGKIKSQPVLDSIQEEEIPFKLPKAWRWSRLIELVTKLTDGTHHSPTNLDTGDFKYVTAKNIKPGGVSLEDITYISKDIHDEIYTRCDPAKGDLLYVKDGATTGVVTINNLNEPFSMLSSVALIKLPEGVNNRLMVLFLRSPFFYEQMRSLMKGAAITRVTLKRMAPTLIPLPPLAEQHRIVAKVDELMALCDELESGLKSTSTTRGQLLEATLEQFRLITNDLERTEVKP